MDSHPQPGEFITTRFGESASSSGGGSPLIVSHFGYNFAQRDTAHFRLMCRTRDCPNSLLADTGDLLERTYRQFYAEFAEAGFKLVPVENRLVWFVFDSQEQYRDFARAADGMNSPYLESYYSAETNQVVLMQTSALLGRPSLQTQRVNQRITVKMRPQWSGMDRPSPDEAEYPMGSVLDVRRAVHEAAHLLAFNSGLQKRGVMYPFWVSEGLATNFESDSVDSVGMARENRCRMSQLQRTREAGQLMPLQDFMILVQAPSRAARANELYAQAWGLFNFLYNHRRTQLQSYLSSLAQLDTKPRESGVMLRECTRAFGSLQQLERSWLQSLDPSPAN